MIRFSKINRILILLCSAIALGVLLLTPMEILGRYTQPLFMMAVIVLLCIVIVFSPRHWLLRPEYRPAIGYMIPYLLSVAVCAVNSWQRYGYSASDLVKTVVPYTYILLAIPLITAFIHDGNCFDLLKRISFIEFGMLTVRFISWFLFNFAGIDLFHRLLFQYQEWLRDGYQRMEAGVLYGVALVIFMICAFKGEKRWRYFVIVGAMFLYLPIVTKVRFQTAVAAGTIFVVFYFIEPVFKKKKAIKNWSIIVFGAIVACILGLPQKVIGLVSVSGQYGEQTLVRLNGIRHYFTMLIQGRAWCGLGFLLEHYDHVRTLMLRDEWSIYFIDDIGICGTITQFGVLTLFLYGTLLFLAFRTCIRCYRKKNYTYFPLLIGLTAYLTVSCVFLSVFDVQRAYDLPFYVAVFSYVNAHLSDEPAMPSFGRRLHIRRS